MIKKILSPITRYDSLGYQKQVAVFFLKLFLFSFTYMGALHVCVPV